MTRAETLYSQLMDLPPNERREFMQLIDQADDLESPADHSLEELIGTERMEEIRRRSDEFKAGASVVDSREAVSRQIRQILQERKA